MTNNQTQQKVKKPTDNNKALKKIILIGGSAGGFKVVLQLLSKLNKKAEAAFIVVLHLSEKVTDNLVERLSEHSALPVHFAKNNEIIKSGKVYVAPPSFHCLVDHKKIRLTKGPRVNRVRPSIDLTFRSAAVEFNSKATGILVSGMLDDGVTGLQAIKSCGGTTIVQSPDEAEHAELPKTAVHKVKPQHVVSSSEIVDLLQEQMSKLNVPSVAVPPAILLENQLDLSNSDDIAEMDKLGGQIPVTCPDCGGPLWEIKDEEKRNSHYRCHVGHVLSHQTLLQGKDEHLEQTLWVAYRTLEEKLRMLEDMARHEQESGRKALSVSYNKRAKETKVHVEKLRKLLYSLNESMLN